MLDKNRPEKTKPKRQPSVVWARTPKSQETNAQKMYNKVNATATIDKIILVMILVSGWPVHRKVLD